MDQQEKPRRPRYYKLEGRRVVPCRNAMEWAAWFETADACVALTKIGPLEVSTIFVGLGSMVVGRSAPRLFETMIFGAVADTEAEAYCRRYATWEAAEAGHAAAVVIARQAAAVIG